MPRGCLPHLQMLIMLLLEQRGPLCGYRIARMLRKLGLSVDDSAVYIILQRLNERGLIEPVEECMPGKRRVKRYRLTDRGRQELENLLRDYDILVRIVSMLRSSKKDI